MNRYHARLIAKRITNKELLSMLDAAKEGIKDWKQPSIVNNRASKGLAWNILASDFNVDEEHHFLYKINLVREFGKFLPEYLKVKKSIDNKEQSKLVHQKPKF